MAFVGDFQTAPEQALPAPECDTVRHAVNQIGFAGSFGTEATAAYGFTSAKIVVPHNGARAARTLAAAITMIAAGGRGTQNDEAPEAPGNGVTPRHSPPVSGGPVCRPSRTYRSCDRAPPRWSRNLPVPQRLLGPSMHRRSRRGRTKSMPASRFGVRDMFSTETKA